MPITAADIPIRRFVPGRQSAYWPLIVWRMAVRWAAGGRSAYASGVAYERISIDPDRMSGLPCIRNTRVTVSAVLGQLATGLTIPELLVDLPYLNRADVLASLEFASAAVQERELPLSAWALPPCVSLSAPTCHRKSPFLGSPAVWPLYKVSIGVGSTFYTPCTNAA
jgi:uncharacterized protein (DUF433 family)